MQSKNKAAPRVSERAHVARVKELSCGVCDLRGPSECHEIKQGQWFTSMPLCPDCHRGEFNGIHGQKRIWSVLKLDELDVLAATIERLYGGRK
jgi:hypothetical protein